MRKIKEILSSSPVGWIIPAVGSLAVLYKTYQYVQNNRHPAMITEEKVELPVHSVSLGQNNIPKWDPFESKESKELTDLQKNPQPPDQKFLIADEKKLEPPEPALLLEQKQLIPMPLVDDEQKIVPDADLDEDEEKEQKPINLMASSQNNQNPSLLSSLLLNEEKEEIWLRHKGSLLNIFHFNPFDLSDYRLKHRDQYIDVIKFFIEKNAPINETGGFIDPKSHTRDEVDSGYYWDYLRFPLKDYIESKSHSVLSTAIFIRDFDLFNILIEAKADFNYTYEVKSKTFNGYLSPLFIACLWFCYNFKQDFRGRNDMQDEMEIMHIIRMLIKKGVDLTICINQLEEIYIKLMKNHNTGGKSNNLVIFKHDKVFDQLFPLPHDTKYSPPTTLKRRADSPQDINFFNLSYLYNELTREQISREIQKIEIDLPTSLKALVVSYLDNRIEERRFLSLPILMRDPSFQCHTLDGLPDNRILFFPVSTQEEKEEVCGYHKIKNIILLTAFFHSFSYDFLLMMNEMGDDSWFEKIFQYCSKHRQHTTEGQHDLSYHDSLKFLKQIFSGKMNEETLGITESRTVKLNKMLDRNRSLSHFSAIRIDNDHKTPLGGAMGEEGLSVAANIGRIALASGRIEHPFALDMNEHSFAVFLIKEKDSFLFALADSLEISDDNLLAVRRILETVNQSKEEIKNYMEFIYENHSGMDNLLKTQLSIEEKTIDNTLNICDQFLCFFDAYTEFFTPKTDATCFFYNKLVRQARLIVNALHPYRFPSHENFSETDEIIMRIYDSLCSKTASLQEDSNHTVALFKKSSSTSSFIMSSCTIQCH